MASNDGLRRATLPEPTPDLCVERLGTDLDNTILAPNQFQTLRTKLFSYFKGELVDFSEEIIDVSDAAAFSRKAWAACRTIPRGETRTYRWLATQTGKPNAPRAAGQAMARNRIPIIIPCHRVVASDGGLGGFSRGRSRLNLKQCLLDLEKTRDLFRTGK